MFGTDPAIGCSKLFAIVEEDAELLIINKPAGLVCHPTKTDQYSSLIGRVRLYLGANSSPQLINRLDRETSGLIVIAKDVEAARQLRKQWESRSVHKEYLAIVHGITKDHGVIEAPLGKDERSTVAIKDCVRPDGVYARTEYWLERSFTKQVTPEAQTAGKTSLENAAEPAAAPKHFSLLRVLPHTGRKHQIRIHLAHEGHPIVGDKIYGGDEDAYLALVEDRLTPRHHSQLLLPHQALHAARLSFDWHGTHRSFHAEPEPWFKAFCSFSRDPD